jgi:dTDP-4-amino-4,6-dideoxygalactose transaminase
MTGKELHYIADAHARRHLSGDGYYTEKCNEWMKKVAEVRQALLTHSCTAALEMAAILLDLEPGDEVIMPSYTFVSTANAFVLRGAVPVFVDVRPDTLNLNENLIESAISNKTKAIVPVHYAGVGCDMDMIMAISIEYGLSVIEDAAQAVMASYKGKPLGGIGDLGAYSFHETKNVISGEGGGLLIKNSIYQERAEMIREKGTDRSKFLRGETDKYTWVDTGSSYLPGEIVAAFLYAQIEEANTITERRRKVWKLYHQMLESLESSGVLRRPIIPVECEHNAHMYYILLKDRSSREDLRLYLRGMGIQATFHYIPLHSSPAGRKYSKSVGDMFYTQDISDRLLRLPIYTELSDDEVVCIVEAISNWAKTQK